MNLQLILCINPMDDGSMVRNSHRRCSIKKGVLKNLTKFTEKYLCWSLYFNKVVGLTPATLLKKRLQHRCFPVNFANFLRTLFLQNNSGRLHLHGHKFSRLRHITGCNETLQYSSSINLTLFCFHNIRSVTLK